MPDNLSDKTRLFSDYVSVLSCDGTVTHFQWQYITYQWLQISSKIRLFSDYVLVLSCDDWRPMFRHTELRKWDGVMVTKNDGFVTWLLVANCGCFVTYIYRHDLCRTCYGFNTLQNCYVFDTKKNLWRLYCNRIQTVTNTSQCQYCDETFRNNTLIFL